MKTEDGQFELETPRDRSDNFEPQLVKKHQRRFTSMDNKILFLYAQGMSTRDIVATFKEMYGADASPTLISKVSDAVIDEVIEWQSRPLDSVYAIVAIISLSHSFAKPTAPTMPLCVPCAAPLIQFGA